MDQDLRTVSRRRLLSLAALGGLTLVGCTAAAGTGGTSSSGASSTGSSADVTGAHTSVTDADTGAGFLAADRVHTVAVSSGGDSLAAAIAAYTSTGDKQWAEVTVSIDGSTYERAGMRLKGNSSLRGISATAAPETLPWLLRLNQFVDGQAHDGMRELVIRSNSSTTALNEAVALDLLAASGLAAQRAAYLALSVGDASPVLRLAVEHPGEVWVDRVFGTSGLLYKAEADGDYTYRGADPAAYDEVFDQETGDSDLGPLIDFLRFVNESTDAVFAAELPTRLDTAALATYLAFQELIDNFDDIDGPGNNSYLWWDRARQRMTVVAWDHNLAFGLRPGTVGGLAGGQPPAAGMPAGGLPPRGQEPAAGMPRDGGAPAAGAGRGPGGKSNPLVTRFSAVADWAASVAAEKTRLTQALVTAGSAAGSLQTWSARLTEQASSLVSSTVVEQEAARIEAYLR
ncbi:MAG: CotH kinase family protein [Actinomycetales bacterium]|nr:CotH kinase family protein [Actinomycetales bacterium]